MRRLAFVLILAMITFISCTKEKDKKKSGIIYFNQANSQQPLEVDGVLYAIGPQTDPQIIMRALQEAQQPPSNILTITSISFY